MTGRATEATVSTLMAEAPVVVGEDETIASVAELLAGYGISGLPVVDASDQLVGVISQTDLVRLRGSDAAVDGMARRPRPRPDEQSRQDDRRVRVARRSRPADDQ